MTRPPLKIGVLGPNDPSPAERARAAAVGHGIARAGAVLICGGLGGVMAAAAETAQRAGGLTVGILPGQRADAANPFIDLALPTGLGAGRNLLVVQACDAVIAIGGRYGTLTEIAFALRLGLPVIGLGTWQLLRDGRPDGGIRVVPTPAAAVRLALRAARTRRLSNETHAPAPP